jgi:hypothetical protein
MAFAIRGVKETHVLSQASITPWTGPVTSRPSLQPPSSGPRRRERRPRHRTTLCVALFEERELGPAHAVHVGIAAVGRGRFSHWTTTVLPLRLG